MGERQSNNTCAYIDWSDGMRAVLLLPNLMTLSIPHQKEAYDGPRQPAQYRKQSATDRRSEVPGSGTRPLHDLVHERLCEDCSRRCAL